MHIDLRSLDNLNEVAHCKVDTPLRDLVLAKVYVTITQEKRGVALISSVISLIQYPDPL